MEQQLQLGQRVQMKPDIEKYGGLFGEIIHREWIEADTVFRRENPEGRPGQGRLSLVVQLEDPSPDLEPIILCYEDQVSLAPSR